MNRASLVHTSRIVLIYACLYVISFGMIASVFYPPLPIHRSFWVENIIIAMSIVYLTRYFIYTMISPWYDAWWAIWKAEHATQLKRYIPRVTVIIPEWNEEVGLVSTVKSVLKNSYKNLEVIVVNDGSTDQSGRVMEEFLEHTQAHARENGKTLRYIAKENGGKGSALNEGIRHATGEIIITIDADCVVQKDAIENFVAHFMDPRVMAVVGNVKIKNTSSFLVTLQHLEFLFSFYFKRADSLLGSIYIIGGAAGAFRKEVFDRLGHYSLGNITEDIELTIRIQNAGYKIVYAADAIVYTEGASDIRGLIKQRLRWKRGRIDTFIQYKKLFFSTEHRHNKFLTWFVLPFAVFGDTELLFEIPFIIFLYVSAVVTRDYTPFISVILIVTLIFYVQAFVPDNKFNKKYMYALAPIGWLMFYFITMVELIALVRTGLSIYKKQRVEWQSWKRVGIKKR